MEDQWNAQRIIQVRGTPRNPSPSSSTAGGTDGITCRTVDDDETSIQQPPTESGIDELAGGEREDSGVKVAIPEGRKMS